VHEASHLSAVTTSRGFSADPHNATQLSLIQGVFIAIAYYTKYV